MQEARAKVLAEYRKALLVHRETDATVRDLRSEANTLKQAYEKTEDDLKALQSVGQIIGEAPPPAATFRTSKPRPSRDIAVTAATAGSPPLASPPQQTLLADARQVLRQLDDERFIVKASSGPRYVVGCRNKIEKAKLVQGTRVSLDMTTLTIMRHLPREVDPVVFNMLAEDPGDVQACAGPESRTCVCRNPAILRRPGSMAIAAGSMSRSVSSVKSLSCH